MYQCDGLYILTLRISIYVSELTHSEKSGLFVRYNSLAVARRHSNVMSLTLEGPQLLPSRGFSGLNYTLPA